MVSSPPSSTQIGDRRVAALRIARSAARLVDADPQSHIALADLMQILENLGILARETINAEFPVQHSLDDAEGRNNWWRAVSFLSATGLFPGIQDLSVALSELDRGRQPESLKPMLTGRGSGARTTHYELYIQKRAVEAADRIGSFCLKDEERDAHLAECGATKRTIERYRESCLKAWPMFWPENDDAGDVNFEAAKQDLRTLMQQAKLLAEERPSKARRAN